MLFRSNDDLILGYPFFAATEPLIHWKAGRLIGTVTATLNSIPIIRKATASTNLAAEAAAKKPHKEWHEIVPQPYHRFKKIFSEEASKRLPSPQVWDHAIELVPNAPATFDCKVYPIAKQEQEALDEFLKEHWKKGYIEQSKSPYASPFFFVKKKDGKLRPV